MLMADLAAGCRPFARVGHAHLDPVLEIGDDVSAGNLPVGGIS